MKGKQKKDYDAQETAWVVSLLLLGLTSARIRQPLYYLPTSLTTLPTCLSTGFLSINYGHLRHNRVTRMWGNLRVWCPTSSPQLYTADPQMPNSQDYMQDPNMPHLSRLYRLIQQAGSGHFLIQYNTEDPSYKDNPKAITPTHPEQTSSHPFCPYAMVPT